MGSTCSACGSANLVTHFCPNCGNALEVNAAIDSGREATASKSGSPLNLIDGARDVTPGACQVIESETELLKETYSRRKQHRRILRWVWIPPVALAVLGVITAGLAIGLPPSIIQDQADALDNAGYFKLAKDLNRFTCMRNHGESCFKLGWDYRKGIGVVQNDSQAVAFYTKACDRGSTNGCNNLGFMYKMGLGVAQDNLRSLNLYTKACAGDATNCDALGQIYETAQGVAQDYSRAVSLYTKACDAGDGAGCDDLGRKYQSGIGVVQDYSRSLALYNKACVRGFFDGCFLLAHMYFEGKGTAQDNSRGVELVTNGCDGGDAPSCVMLGAVYEFGTIVAQDMSRAVALYTKACDASSAEGCNNAGAMYGSGNGVAQDISRARVLYTKACNAGLAMGCTNLQGLDQEEAETQAETRKHQEAQTAEEGEPISYDLFYAKSKSTGLPVGKRYRFMADVEPDPLAIHESSGFSRIIVVEPAFDDMTKYESFLRGENTRFRTIVASMGSDGQVQVHRIE